VHWFPRLISVLLLALGTLGAEAQPSPQDLGPLIRQAVTAGHWQRAETLLKQWLQQLPNDPRARLWQARLALWRNHGEQALKLAQALATQYPDDADILLLLAQAQATNDHPSEALTTLDRLHHLAPDYPDAWRLHLNLLRRLQREQAYFRLLRQLRSRHPERPWPRPRTAQTIGLSQQSQILDRGLSPWLRWQLNYRRQALTQPTSLTLQWARERRFDLWDDQLGLQLQRRLPRGNWQARALFSPQHQVLAASEIGARLSHNLPAAFDLGLDLSQRHYTRSSVTTLATEIGHHRGPTRLGYRLTLARLMVGATSASHLLRLDRPLTASWHVRTSLWWGRELEYAPSLGILESRVRGLGADLSHRRGPWRLDLGALWHRQGQRYTRGGIHLALHRQL